MKGEKDEGKRMFPLFPDNKEGHRAPPTPRNKMALFDEYNLSKESSKIESRSRSILPVPPATGCGSFASQASSSNNVAGAKRKLRPSSAEWYYGHCSQNNPSCSANPMIKAKRNDVSVPSFLQSRKTLNHRNLQLLADKETTAAFCSVSSGKRHSACINLSKNDDPVTENHGVETHKLSQNNGLIKKCADDVAVKVGLDVKREEVSDIFMERPIPCLNLTTDEVVRVIGQRLFLKARNIMVHQQKVFSKQMFELHKLITVQRLMARSPEILHGNNFRPNQPLVKFPPMNKLLYISPLDTSPSTAKPKADAPVGECGPEPVRELLPLPKTNVENGHLAQPLTPNMLGPLTNAASIPVDSKLAPWYLPPQPGNQWLIPVRSPSEGLVYKPYPGPCFPTAGFLGPVCSPISLSSLNGVTYGSNEPKSGAFYGPELVQSYFQHYPTPSTNATSPNNETKPIQDCERNQPGSPEATPPERTERDALCLFPTTPSFLKDQKDEQRVEVIKVVPHNRNSAPASAARIFQCIQEERRKHE